MLVRVILAMALAIMLFGGSGLNGFGIQSFKNSAKDKEIETNTTILDKGIVSWYCNHSGVLPDGISTDHLKIMGLEDMDTSMFTYTKIADNQFTLTAKLSNNKTLSSANSNRELPDVEIYGNTPAE